MLVNTALLVAVQVSSSLGDIRSCDLYSLKEVVNRWHSVQAAKPRLLLRVMRRSKLFHYAKPNIQVKWPFQVGVCWLGVGGRGRESHLIVWLGGGRGRGRWSHLMIGGFVALC